MWLNALAHFRDDHSRFLHAPDHKEPAIRENDTLLIKVMRKFLSSTTKYLNLLAAGVRTQINETINSKRTRFASKNIGWTDSWMARMSLTVPHFNNPHVYFIDLVSISP
jgi:hypothetical protein